MMSPVGAKRSGSPARCPFIRGEFLQVRLALLCALVAALPACSESDNTSVRAPSVSLKADVPTGSESDPSAAQQEPQRGNDPEYGQMFYANSCMSCHGSRGQGMPHQGVGLRSSRFIAQQNDEQLVAFLKTGRTPNDPQTLQGLLMPPRGGNQSLDDTALGDIVAFLRQLQDEIKKEEPTLLGAQDPTSEPLAATNGKDGFAGEQ